VTSPIRFALAGNPNCGKTTLFNPITGANQRVGNYPGITVDRKEGAYRYDGIEIKIIDLPVTYSLSPYSMEEIVARGLVYNCFGHRLRKVEKIKTILVQTPFHGEEYRKVWA